MKVPAVYWWFSELLTALLSLLSGNGLLYDNNLLFPSYIKQKSNSVRNRFLKDRQMLEGFRTIRLQQQ